MTTGAVIVQDALAKRFILAPGQEPDQDQMAFGLRWLNRMLQAKSAEIPNLFKLDEEVFNLATGVASYSTSLLSGGRPVSINYLFNRLSDVDYPCELVDNQTYADVMYKPVNAVPNICYYDDNMPNGTLNFFPRPYAVFECHVYVNRLLVAGTIDEDTDIVLPPGYEAAVIDALAVYYPYEVPASPAMERDARNGWALLKRLNYTPLISKLAIDRSYSVNNDFPMNPPF